LAIALRYAARSDVGLVRSNNQDSAYAGPHLLVVADGMGGHAGGDVASSLAIGELAPLDDESHGADALDHLSEAVQAAHQELLDRVDEEPTLAGMGTTVTALLRTGNRLALAHIGDSRAYLLREGGLVQITKDHTFVQTLVDEGRLTVTEAEHHPQRSVLMRVLSDVVDDVTPDLSMREARIGDRYLLCSDGLSGVVSLETLQETLAEVPDPTSTCEALVQLALRAGAPDNVTCIVADVIEDAARGDVAPFVVGAASLHQPRRGLPGAQGSAAERAAALTAAGDGDEEDDSPAASLLRPTRRRAIGGAALAVLLLLGGGFGAWRWVASQIFVGDSGGAVAVFSGLPQDLGPVSLSRVQTVADDVLVADLPDYARDQLVKGVPADTDAKALEIVAKYRTLARCQALATATPTPSPSPTPSPTPTGAPTPTPAVALTAGAAAKPTPTGSRPASAAAGVTPSAPAPAPTLTPTPSPSASPELDCAGLLQ
jgi:protein phosphatase